jgi:hypothetical protein
MINATQLCFTKLCCAGAKGMQGFHSELGITRKLFKNFLKYHQPKPVLTTKTSLLLSFFSDDSCNSGDFFLSSDSNVDLRSLHIDIEIIM